MKKESRNLERIAASASTPPPAPLETPWSRPAAEVASALEVDPAVGLSADEAGRRLATHGRNLLQEIPPASLWGLLGRQFRSLIVALLAVAAGLSFALGEAMEGVTVLIVLAINTGLGFLIEWRATRSMEALRQLVTLRVRVRRDGTVTEMAAGDLVPGDLILVEAGDIVAADARLVEAAELESDESSLTGESMPVAKSPAAVGEATALPERTNHLYRGSRITRGNGSGVVVATGLASELGKISSLVAQAEREVTPLEKRLAQLGGRLVWLTLAVAVATVATGILTGKEFAVMLRTAIALAVAAIPEGLPVVATIALARGLWRMAERDALINRLSAVETLGATGVICTDKTGTLTENRLTVRRVVLPEGGETELEPASGRAELGRLLRLAVLCNNADGATGDPLETALLEAARRAGFDPGEIRRASPRLREAPFDSERRLMATIHRDGGACEVAVKGAPEAVLAACRMDEAGRARWHRANERLADEGLRVIAVAGKAAGASDGDPFRDLEMAGLVGLIDPPRPDVPEAIRQCRAAGIRVVMVTGDQPRTGLAIARAVGLAPAEGAVAVIHGDEFDALEADEEGLAGGTVFARVTPSQKYRLVRLHQARGSVVAMTGDGVNDAPALKQADIGVAMGKRGTEVAREASDMVLRDDAFPSIVVAIAQGRAIFANIRKFVTYLLACNLSEILVIGAATIFARSLPILPLQILFLNLVTDVFPALALGVGPAGENLMNRPPRPAGEPIVRPREWRRIVADGLVIALATLGSYATALHGLGQGAEDAVTVSFLTLALAQIVHVFNMAHSHSSFFRSEVVRNPYMWAAIGLCLALLWAACHVAPLAAVLGLHPPSRDEWLVILGFGFVPAVYELLRRLATPAPDRVSCGA